MGHVSQGPIDSCATVTLLLSCLYPTYSLTQTRAYSQYFTLGYRSWAPKAREARHRKRREGELGRGRPPPQPIGVWEASWVLPGSGVEPRPPTHSRNIWGPQNTSGRTVLLYCVTLAAFFVKKIHSVDDWGACPLFPLATPLTQTDRWHVEIGKSVIRIFLSNLYP